MAADCTKIFPSKSAKVRGVVIVAHGANLRPTRMDELSLSLQENGFTVLRPGFTGHCPSDPHGFAKVSAEEWLADARRFHAEAKQLAHAANAPLYLAAYSFSAPIFMVQHQELPFDKRILFAPAFETKWWYPAARLLAWALPLSFRYKSMNMADYRANNYGGAASARALDIILSRWKRELAPNLQDAVPTLLFMDPKDELLSYQATKNFLVEKNWSNWRLEDISNAGATTSSKMHHLVIDSASLGKAEWERVVKLSLQFLSEA